MISLNITNVIHWDFTNSEFAASLLTTKVNIDLHSFEMLDLACTCLLTRRRELGSSLGVVSETWAHRFPGVALPTHGVQARLRSPLRGVRGPDRTRDLESVRYMAAQPRFSPLRGSGE